ncbi:hypothetical protein [Lutibacter sp.]|uniref:hypothetical protein n=1 Tax=Lutibacter sp. TaxID=1925666 RepID=UPI0025B826CB|nr:hypothetical protein [Lutibacter sp.]MCF6181811.1 hypothetical protein [Lutibacter sp.]
MKLTKEQIQNLYKFTRQHYVEHYDLQTELVDHLANDIEKIWEEQPTLSFEQAKTISFKKFGVFGFMDVIAARQKAMSKKYWKIIGRFIKQWFQLPKIILTALLFISFYTVCKTTFATNILLIVLIILVLYAFYKGILLNKTLKRNFNQNGKKWMLEEMIFKTGMGSFMLIPVNFLNFINIFHKDNLGLSNVEALVYATLFTFLIMLFYIVLEVLPKKAEELLLENYPEYKLV